MLFNSKVTTYDVAEVRKVSIHFFNLKYFKYHGNKKILFPYKVVGQLDEVFIIELRETSDYISSSALTMDYYGVKFFFNSEEDIGVSFLCPFMQNNPFFTHSL